jgi:hypothetical protein
MQMMVVMYGVAMMGGEKNRSMMSVMYGVVTVGDEMNRRMS